MDKFEKERWKGRESNPLDKFQSCTRNFRGFRACRCMSQIPDADRIASASICSVLTHHAASVTFRLSPFRDELLIPVPVYG